MWFLRVAAVVLTIAMIAIVVSDVMHEHPQDAKSDRLPLSSFQRGN